jgi:hypothetical protein
VGLSIAPIAPHAEAKQNTIHSWIAPLTTRIPMSVASNAYVAAVTIRMWRLSKRSASLPPMSVRNRTGMNCSAVT